MDDNYNVIVIDKTAFKTNMKLKTLQNRILHYNNEQETKYLRR